MSRVTSRFDFQSNATHRRIRTYFFQLSFTRVYLCVKNRRRRSRQAIIPSHLSLSSRSWWQREALSREIAPVQNICTFRALCSAAWHCCCGPCGHGTVGATEWPVTTKFSWMNVWRVAPTVAHPNRLNIFQWGQFDRCAIKSSHAGTHQRARRLGRQLITTVYILGAME